MVYNINEECFKSNEFLELIKNRKQTTKINQNPICLAQKMKLHSQDTNFILIDSTTHHLLNSKITNDKGSSFDNKNDNNFFTEKSILDIKNKIQFYKSEENDIPINVTNIENKNINENTTDEPCEDIILKRKNIFEILNCEKDIFCNQGLLLENKTDDLHRYKIFQNVFWGNIYMITRKNTLFNKKISFTQKYMEREIEKMIYVIF